LENQNDIVNYLSIDVEDYFHVSAFESISPPSSWPARDLRVEKNTDKILSALNAQSVKATFFVLGWVADRCPGRVERIAAEGHD
jgi:peptidoglycan/xylan/chitin deacetylase (PgdA/CDA1 family)